MVIHFNDYKSSTLLALLDQTMICNLINLLKVETHGEKKEQLDENWNSKTRSLSSKYYETPCMKHARSLSAIHQALWVWLNLNHVQKISSHPKWLILTSAHLSLSLIFSSNYVKYVDISCIAKDYNWLFLYRILMFAKEYTYVVKSLRIGANIVTQQFKFYEDHVEK